MTLTDLLKTETPTIEWKQSANSNDILHAVCALANDLGDTKAIAHLVLGISKNGDVVGLDLAAMTIDEEQQRLAGRLSSVKLFPTPSFAIHPHEINGQTILVVEITPYPVPPVVKVDGVPWVRRGTTTMRASEADLIRLSERRPERNQAFDLRVVRGTTINDLNTLLLEKYYLAAKEENELPGEFPALQSWLTLRQLGKETNGTWTPNAAGLLLFGQSPQDHFPGARVEFVKYAGIDVDSPIAERATVTGTLTDQIESLWTRINANVVDVPKIDQGAVTLYRKTYPINGMRELIRNMIQHRLYEGTNAPGRVEWYDNRVEISNPGGPFGRASEGEFGSHSDYRNPVITQWLAELGYVEQLGRGVRLLRISLQKNGNPDLAVELDGFTRVIVRRTP